MCYSTRGFTRQVSLACLYTAFALHHQKDLSFISSSVTSNNRSMAYNEQKEFYWNVYTQG